MGDPSPEESGGTPQSLDRGIALIRLAMHHEPDTRPRQVGRDLDPSDRDGGQPRVTKIPQERLGNHLPDDLAHLIGAAA